jgi:hypothetical protein
MSFDVLYTCCSNMMMLGHLVEIAGRPGKACDIEQQVAFLISICVDDPYSEAL